MRIHLLRTSLASVDAPDVPEARRWLSLEGRRIVRAIATKIRQDEEPSFDRFVTGLAPAAVQTAELFAERTDYVGVIEALPLLDGDAPPSVVAPLLLARGTSIVVVTDEPMLAALGAFLVGRPTFPPALHGQISAIEGRTPAWCLRPGDLARQLLLVA